MVVLFYFIFFVVHGCNSLGRSRNPEMIREVEVFFVDFGFV